MLRVSVISVALIVCAMQAATAADLRVPRSVVRQYLYQQSLNQQMPPPVMYQQPMYQSAPPVGCTAASRDVVSAAFNSAVCAALLPFNIGQMMITGAAATVQGTTGIGR